MRGTGMVGARTLLHGSGCPHAWGADAAALSCAAGFPEGPGRVVSKQVGDAIYHVHGKDTYVDHLNVAVNGCNDHKPYERIAQRAWTFRSIGYGHDTKMWKDIVSALRLVGYDYVISIEHEDAMMSQDEGLAKGVALLKEAGMAEPAGDMFWA